MRRARQALGALAVLIVAGCGTATTAATHQSGGSRSPRPAGSADRSPSPGPASRPAPKPRPAVVPASVALSSFRAADGSLITLAVFRGGVSFRLHAGSQDPGYPALSTLHAGPAIVGGERRGLLAAFNGGFKLSQGAGGYEQEGHVVSPLIRGMASLVIDRSGAAVIGVWGFGLPRPGEEDAAGQLIYAGSMSASPADLAAALVHAGARRAMELDINPEWVQLDVARHPGHRLTAAIPGQNRPAGQFLVGWIRDFITVLAAR